MMRETPIKRTAPVKTSHLGISRFIFFIALSPIEHVKTGDLS
jgi:hypothetical protein